MVRRFGLCVIIDEAAAAGRGALEVARAALAGGAPMLQLRDKSRGLRELLAPARTIANLCRHAGALFLVNDRLDLALAARAHGLHVGQDDLPAAHARRLLPPGAILGVSAHSVEQARAAEAAGADYLGVGPAFATATKATGRAPLGPAGIGELCRAVSLPVLAIGGITADRVAPLLDAGAAGVAVIGAIVGAPDIADATRAFLRALGPAGPTPGGVP